MKKLAVGAGAGIIAAIVAFTAPMEGLRTKAYPDPAKPTIATICYGETQGVHFGETRTAEECRQMLAKRIPDYLGPVDRLMPGLPDNRRIAYTDFAYNAGVGTLSRRTRYCLDKGVTWERCSKARRVEVEGTSVVDMERAGDWRKACARLKDFVYAGGKVYPGLVRRREAEYKTCMGVK